MASGTDGIAPLLDRLKEGDQAALAELFSIYRSRLGRMLELRMDKRLGGRVSASDVLQETYIDALKRVPHYLAKPEMPFFVWLRWVANQRLIDVHRRHLGAQMRDAGQEQSLGPGPLTHASAASMAGQLAAHLASPSQAAAQAELSAMIEKALEGMDPIDREVLAMRHFEELSNNEVAQILGIAKAAASNRYVRALKRLKEALAKVPGFFDEVRGSS
jgi:RNA polymerase sigma-70 factor (ECF subfamily)